MGKGVKGIDPAEVLEAARGQKHEAIERAEQRFEATDCDDAELVVVAFGSLARFARNVGARAARRGRARRPVPPDLAVAVPRGGARARGVARAADRRCSSRMPAR
jgi:hypothetical protein